MNNAMSTDAIKLPFGLKDGTIVHISEVARGKDCNCVCPFCRQTLIAKKGDKKTEHFSHSNENDKCDCSYESILHLGAKKILLEKKRLYCPEVILKFEDKEWEINKDQVVKFDRVVDEEQFKNIRPDILAYKQNKPLIVEICVTHPVDPDKISIIKENGISAIEIYLQNNLEYIDWEEFSESVINKARRTWLYNRKISDIKNEIIRVSEDPLEDPIVSWRDFGKFCPRNSKEQIELFNCHKCRHHFVIDGKKYCLGTSGISNYKEYEKHMNHKN